MRKNQVKPMNKFSLFREECFITEKNSGLVLMVEFIKLSRFPMVHLNQLFYKVWLLKPTGKC